MRPFRPSNATMGDSFIAHFCDKCTKAKNEGHGPTCPILGATMAFSVDDPGYPKEWMQDDEGAECTAFEPTQEDA